MKCWPSILHSVKLECPESLVHLSSDSSEGGLPSASLPTPTTHTLVSNSKYNEHSKSVFTSIESSGHSNFSRPSFHPNTRECPNVIQCFRRLASIPGLRNKLSLVDYDKISYQKVQYLQPSYNGDVIFELPPSRVSASSSKNAMDSMDKQLNGHTWCRTITSNIHNSQGLTFRKSSCVDQLVCNNQSCDFFTKTSKQNETKWSSQTNSPFSLGLLPPPDWVLICKVSKVPHTCVNVCNAHIYYVLSKSDMARAYIHLGMHKHPIFDDICRDPRHSS